MSPPFYRREKGKGLRLSSRRRGRTAGAAGLPPPRLPRLRRGPGATGLGHGLEVVRPGPEAARALLAPPALAERLLGERGHARARLLEGRVRLALARQGRALPVLPDRDHRHLRGRVPARLPAREDRQRLALGPVQGHAPEPGLPR